ncbi:MAG: nucleoside 2-deoxyribosyltransferase [Solirubrobacteraceae bacterium]
MPAPATPTRLPRCYIASPLGFTEAGRDYYRRVYLPALASVVEPVDPWALTAAHELAAAVGQGREAELHLTIGRRNAEAIRSSELLAAYLDGQEPDSGTVAELGYGAALGLTCFGLRSDLRQNGEEGGSLNLQLRAFIGDSGGALASSLDALVAQLRDWSAARP